ncbi:MAG: hypothetical protein AAB431_01320 [Patescibacteria group bacterium]
MRSLLSPKWIFLLFFVLLSGLLVVRRFDMPTQESVQLVSSTGSEQTVGHLYKRGEMITTKPGEHLFIQIGNDVSVAIDERTSLELWRISEKERVLRFPRGRIVVEKTGGTPVRIETNQTENTLVKGKTIFINFDFLQSVTIAPVVGSIQTHIKGTEEYMVLPLPISIKETTPPVLSKISTSPTEGASAAFHAWADLQFDQRVKNP